MAHAGVEAIRQASEAVSTASQGLAQRLYQQAASGADASGPTPGSDDEIVDAEIVDAEMGEERRSA